MKNLLSKAIEWYCTATADAYSHEINAAYTHHKYHI